MLGSFLELKVNNKYRYSKCIDDILEEEFKRIKGTHYVDHAGSSLYSEIQLATVLSLHEKSLFGNPHSRNQPSETVTHSIDAMRSRVLQHFNTTSKEYDLIFTSGASSAIKIVGESFALQEDNGELESFVYTQENHTSILGLRDIFQRRGVNIHCLQSHELLNLLQKDSASGDSVNYGLLAYPAECNYSGSKYPLDWIKMAHDGCLNNLKIKDQNTLPTGKNMKWFVLLDAACFVSTSPLDLSKWKPDFVPISFYKLFGYPTGLGCLLVHRRAWNVLDKTFYGGGTVQMIDSRLHTLVPRKYLHERFEDGTPNFLGIMALNSGFDTLKRITGGMENIEDHVFNIVNYLFHNFRSLRHSNGQRVVEMYSESEFLTKENHGSILNFNLRNSKGHLIGFNQVERVASLYNVYLRTGCVCNPGACQKYLNISSELLKQHFQAGHTCGDSLDIIDGHPTGSVRVSFGYVSTYDDADRIIQMIIECFVDGEPNFDKTWMTKNLKTNDIEKKLSIESKEKNLMNLNVSSSFDAEVQELDKIKRLQLEPLVDIQLPSLPDTTKSSASTLILKEIIIYPIKSCAGVSLNVSKITSSGLQFDRHWMIVTSTGVTLTQKRIPRLALIQPFIDLDRNILTLSCKGYESVKVDLYEDEANNENDSGSSDSEATMCGGRVCGERIRGLSCGSSVAKWLSHVIGMNDLKLLKQVDRRRNKMAKLNSASALSLANESQYLVVHEASLRELKYLIEERGLESLTVVDLKLRFRPNFVIEGGDPYEEDSWKSIKVKNLEFKIHGPCGRCQMVSVSPASGNRSKEPLITLGETRGPKMTFGVHASYHPSSLSSEDQFVSPDTEVQVRV